MAEYLFPIVFALFGVLLIWIFYTKGEKNGALEMKKFLQKPPSWTDLLPKGVKCTWRGGPFRVSETASAGLVEYPSEYSSRIATIEIDGRIIKAELEPGDEFVITEDWQIIKNANKSSALKADQ